jgi:probable F420-dependent oxidoreductase
MAFTISVTLPFDDIHHGDEFVSMDAVHDIARAMDESGIYAGTVTDHPVPSYRWLDAGGHYAQDPFVMLSLLASITKRVRLQTNIVVLPYRNPFITARAVSSLDAFSGGRFIFGIGAGYLKPEYKALGVDFDSRNDLMDEYIRAMKLAWTGEDFTFEGTGYTAVGNRVRPTPVQQPHPPLLIGGNSKRALRRAVDLGDYWNPFVQPKAVTDTARTANVSGPEDVLEAMAYMKDYAEKVERPEPKVVTSGTYVIQPGFNAQEALDHCAAYQKIGVTGTGASIRADNRAAWCDLLREFGDKVVSKLG